MYRSRISFSLSFFFSLNTTHGYVYYTRTETLPPVIDVEFHRFARFHIHKSVHGCVRVIDLRNEYLRNACRTNRSARERLDPIFEEFDCVGFSFAQHGLGTFPKEDPAVTLKFLRERLRHGPTARPGDFGNRREHHRAISFRWPNFTAKGEISSPRVFSEPLESTRLEFDSLWRGENGVKSVGSLVEWDVARLFPYFRDSC